MKKYYKIYNKNRRQKTIENTIEKAMYIYIFNRFQSIVLVKSDLPYSFIVQCTGRVMYGIYGI